MKPFDSYPDAGRVPLGLVKNRGNCRPGYGRKFMQLTGQTHCAYCGLDFTASYRDWLQMELDHVVPTSLCGLLGLHAEWIEDASNKVLACRACNGFENRYKPEFELACPDTLADFYDLRDRIFAERKQKIARAHERARALFAARPWERKRLSAPTKAACSALMTPSRPGACHAVWESMDEVRAAQNGAIPHIRQLKALATKNGWNMNNAIIEYYRWRKFNGITGRLE